MDETTEHADAGVTTDGGGPADDRAAGRDAILDAAERLFADKGFSGTSLRALARAAGTSQALIHHHFGTKAGLWKAVKRRFVENMEASEVGEAMSIRRGPDHDPIASMVAAMQAYAMFLRANPRMLRVAAWVRLEGDNAPWMERSKLLEAMHEALRESQAMGLLRASLDIRMHLALVGSVVEHWVQNGAEKCQAMGLEGDPDTLTERYLRQAAESLLLGVLPDAHPARSSGDPR